MCIKYTNAFLLQYRYYILDTGMNHQSHCCEVIAIPDCKNYTLAPGRFTPKLRIQNEHTHPGLPGPSWSCDPASAFPSSQPTSTSSFASSTLSLNLTWPTDADSPSSTAPFRNLASSSIVGVSIRRKRESLHLPFSMCSRDTGVGRKILRCLLPELCVQDYAGINSMTM